MEERFSLDINQIAERVSGKCVSRLDMRGKERVAITFVDGSSFIVRRLSRGLAIDFVPVKIPIRCPEGDWPTSRQVEYLDFIKKYML